VNAYRDVAITFTSRQEKSSYNGKDVSGHYHFTDVWVKKTDAGRSFLHTARGTNRAARRKVTSGTMQVPP
jgi:hypothetical protein